MTRARLALPVLLALAGPACDDAQVERPSEPRLLVFAVNDPVLDDPAAPEPARIVWLSTRAGLAWISLDGSMIGDRFWAEGGELQRTEIWPSALGPHENQLVLTLAPDTGEDPLRAVVGLTVAADCTRAEHCLGRRCVGFACVD